MGFEIGSQSANIINNVDGDQRIDGGQEASGVTFQEARIAVQDLRDGLATASLNPSQASLAKARVEEIDSEMRNLQPDRSFIAKSLHRLTELFVSAGRLATAGAALVGPLRTLGTWLGTLGAPVLHLLPMLA